MAVDVQTETTIRRPLETVAAFAADPDNAPRWYVNIRAADWLTAPPLAVGSRISFSAQFLGRTLTYTYEVTAYEPGRHLTMRTAEGPFPMETTYTWQAVDATTTHMTLCNRGAPQGFARLSAPLVAHAMRRANQKDLARLKTLLEAQPDPAA